MMQTLNSILRNLYKKKSFLKIYAYIDVTGANSYLILENSIVSYNSLFALLGTRTIGGIWVHHVDSSMVFESFVSKAHFLLF